MHHSLTGVGFSGTSSLLNGILGYWRLESGDPTLDVNGANGLGATSVGTFEAAFKNNGFRLPPATSITESTLNSAFNTSFMTLSLWLKVNTAPSVGISIAQKFGNDGGGNDGWRVMLTSSLLLSFEIYTNGAQSGTFPVAGLATGFFYFVVFRMRTPGDAKIDIYDDLGLINSTTGVNSFLAPASTFKFTLGNAASALLNFTSDEIGLWNRGLSDVEVEKLWNFGVGRFYPFVSNRG